MSRLLGLAKISLSEFEVATGREWTAESSYPLQDEQGCITEVKNIARVVNVSECTETHTANR